MAIHIPMIQGRIITITTGGSTPSEPTAPNGKVLYKTSANGDWIQSDADITDGTFNDFDEIKSAVAVILPSKDASGNTVTNIGYRAFYRCDSLTSITIPNNVTSIGENTFYGCNGLTRVTFNNFDVSTTKTQITENHIFGTKFHDEN